MRLLPERHDHGGGGPSEGEAETDRPGHRRGHHQYLPLRHLPAGARGNPRRQTLEEATMNQMPKLNRRAFVIGTAADEGAAVEFGHLVHGCLLKRLAAWIASRTCWKVPQRQILVMASSMSWSVGFGFSFRRAATAMIMPLWQ